MRVLDKANHAEGAFGAESPSSLPCTSCITADWRLGHRSLMRGIDSATEAGEGLTFSDAAVAPRQSRRGTMDFSISQANYGRRSTSGLRPIEA